EKFKSTTEEELQPDSGISSAVVEPVVTELPVESEPDAEVSNSTQNEEPIKFRHPIFSHPSEDEGDEEEEKKISFEPFHTVDYFASQGIKVSPEIKAEDRLGK